MSEIISLLDPDEQEYISNRRYKTDFPGLQEAMSEPRFTISDLGVTARDATYWSMD